MKTKYLMILLTGLILLLIGCSTQTVVKYQCTDGSFANSESLCKSNPKQTEVVLPIYENKEDNMLDKTDNINTEIFLTKIKNFRIPNQYKPVHVSLSDNASLVLVSDSNGNLYKIQDGIIRKKTFDAGGGFHNYASPNSEFYVSVSGNGIGIYTTNDDSVVFVPSYTVKFYDNVIRAMDFSDDTNFLVFGNNGGKLVVYKNKSVVWKKEIGVGWDILKMDSPKSRILAIASGIGDSTIYLLDINTGLTILEIDYNDNSEYMNPIYDAGIGDDGFYICQDNLIKFFNIKGELIKQESSYFGCYYDYTSKKKITFPTRDTMNIEVEGKVNSVLIPEDLYQMIVFSKNGKYLASYNPGFDHDVRIFKIN